MIRVGIVGATGYTGGELLRLLSAHPEVEVLVVTSRTSTGRKVCELFPHLRGHYTLKFTDVDAVDFRSCDCVFYATPHTIAMDKVPKVLSTGVRVIDLSADFRLRDVSLWEHWYKVEHKAKAWLEKAVYGLPELNRESIKTAQLVANPGCYPTAVSLGLMPLLEQDCIHVESIIADAKSGVSGAGRKAAIDLLLAEMADNFYAYGISGHRHLPEITQVLSTIAGKVVKPVFVPHLVPMIRGMEVTLYATLKRDVALQTVYEQCYQQESFVDVLPAGVVPDTRSVRGSNMCRIAVCDTGKGRIVISVVIDNLVKGASGQAIQNMNLMFALPETAGLGNAALMP